MGNSSPDIRTLFSFACEERAKKETSILSWLLPGERRKEKEEGFIDALCERVYHLPSVYAAMQTVPEAGDLPVNILRDRAGIMGDYGADGIRISAGDAKNDWLDAQTATLPHELRHGYQDHVKCLPDLRSGDVTDYIFYNRVMEADATAFSVAALYEHWLDSGDVKPLDNLRQHHPEVVDAYYESLWENEEAHWDGSAANAAFKAYFANDDKGNLKFYDMTACEIFSKAAGNNASPGIDKTVLMASLTPLASMPYMNDLGNVRQRPNYKPQDVDYNVIMGHISPEVKAYIQQAKNNPGPV